MRAFVQSAGDFRGVEALKNEPLSHYLGLPRTLVKAARESYFARIEISTMIAASAARISQTAVPPPAGLA